MDILKIIVLFSKYCRLLFNLCLIILRFKTYVVYFCSCSGFSFALPCFLVRLVILTDYYLHSFFGGVPGWMCSLLRGIVLPVSGLWESYQSGTLFKPFLGLWLSGSSSLWMCAWDVCLGWPQPRKCLVFPSFFPHALSSAGRTCSSFSCGWERGDGSIVVHSFPVGIILWSPNFTEGEYP